SNTANSVFQFSTNILREKIHDGLIDVFDMAILNSQPDQGRNYTFGRGFEIRRLTDISAGEVFFKNSVALMTDQQAVQPRHLLRALLQSVRIEAGRQIG